MSPRASSGGVSLREADSTTSPIAPACWGSKACGHDRVRCPSCGFVVCAASWVENGVCIPCWSRPKRGAAVGSLPSRTEWQGCELIAEYGR